MPPQVKDNLDLNQPNFLDIFVDYRRILVGAVVLVSLVLALYTPHMAKDPSLQSGIDTSSPSFQAYRKFVDVFGSEEFLLVVIKSDQGARDERMLDLADRITRAMERRDRVVEVISLTNLNVFQERKGLFGNYPLLLTVDGKLRLPEAAVLDKIRTALPLSDYLLSRDLLSVGVLIRVDDRWKFDQITANNIIEEVERMVRTDGPPGAVHRIVGAAIVRGAIVDYSIQTGIVFGVLCMIIATIVSVYIFKSLRITMLANVILAICVLWVLGLMVIARIPLNSTTALSFGFIPITTLEIVIHMVVRYRQFHRETGEKIAAVKKGVRWLARPCFICSTTTAVGFGSLMVSSIPMVQQLGFIMSVGIMISYLLAFILTPAFFVWMKTLGAAEPTVVKDDWLSGVLGKLESVIFSHFRLIAITGFVVTGMLFAGAPFIRSDVQILRMLSERTQEIRDLKFVESNLTAVNAVELLVEFQPDALKRADTWATVRELEDAIRKNPEVVGTDSLLPLLDYLNQIMDPKARSVDDLFAQPGTVPQLIGMMPLSGDGKRMLRRFVDEDYGKLRLSVRIRNSPDVTMGTTIAALQGMADSVLKGTARATVTGDLTVVEGQTSELIKDQLKSLLFASIIITGLMMIQLKSFLLGLISLLPNIPAVAAVFGLMGWMGISLDGVTVFAATVAIGMAVDNTIHFLTQLKREIKFNPGRGMEECLRTAYQLTARQISSYSMVTLMAFLALSVSPFRPVVLFGVLGFASIGLGLCGDLVWLQSLILWSRRIRNGIERLIERELQAELRTDEVVRGEAVRRG